MPSRVRFNHVELTLPKGALDEKMRADIGAFYTSVFGWEAGDIEVRGVSHYLLRCNDGHAVLIGESATPMSAVGFDHLGLLCPLRSDVDELLEQCQRYRDKDDRVRIIEYEDLKDYGNVVHAFKVKYLLPLQFDVTCYELPDGTPEVDDWRYVESSTEPRAEQ